MQTNPVGIEELVRFYQNEVFTDPRQCYGNSYGSIIRQLVHDEARTRVPADPG